MTDIFSFLIDLIVSFIPIIFIIMIPIILYRRLYFKPIVFLCVTPESTYTISLKPFKSFKRFFDHYSIVHVSEGLCAVVNSDFANGVSVNNVLIGTPIFLCRVKYGRLRSISLSDRSIHDFIAKLNS